MSVSLLVSLLSYWNHVNIGIYPVLDDIYFWIFLETFLGYFCTVFNIFCISCMSVRLSLSLLYLFQLVISGGQLLRPLVLFMFDWLFWRVSFVLARLGETYNLECYLWMNIFNVLFDFILIFQLEITNIAKICLWNQ